MLSSANVGAVSFEHGRVETFGSVFEGKALHSLGAEAAEDAQHHQGECRFRLCSGSQDPKEYDWYGAATGDALREGDV